MTLQASLPMYARPELDPANAALWDALCEAIAKHGIDSPKNLDPNGVGYAYWESPDLLFSQTCGYPYRTRLRDKVTLLGTPDYGLDGCPPGHYYSVFVTHRASTHQDLSNLQGATFAINSRDSQSGFQGPIAHAASLGVTLQPTRETGSHQAAAKAVAARQADVAAIDAITWRHLTAYDDFTRDLAVIGQTHPVPGLPLITGQHHLAVELRSAIQETFANLPTAARPLGLTGIAPLSETDYGAERFAPPPFETT